MSFAIAIDIGTTNIEAALIEVTSDSYRIMSIELRPNVNKKFGRDVMTRITQAERGNLHEMSVDLRAQLSEMVSELSKEVDITQIVIACNTTMTHILLEENCHNLGVYPFSPVHTKQTNIMSTDIEILPGHDPLPVTVLPGFSAYVGGDIVSGVLSLDLMNKQGRSLLIDLGTNGEMVYHDSVTGRMLVTSTAAGPAFELAGRSKATEIIKGISDLYKQGIIDETGLLTDEYFETGYKYGEVNITQSFIRDVQTAKSAIRAGIEILLDRTDTPDNIYISGAFGENLDTDAAISIGMLPESFKDHITLCGNTSLSGAIKYCVDQKDIVIPDYEEIILANEDSFNDLYIEYLSL